MPIGALAPGELGLGSAMVSLPQSDVSRIDQVHVDIYAEAHAPLSVEPVRLSIEGRDVIPMAASGTLLRGETEEVRPVCQLLAEVR